MDNLDGPVEPRHKGNSNGGFRPGRFNRGWNFSRESSVEMTREDADNSISRALTRILRHEAKRFGIALDDEGFARLDEVLQNRRIQALGATLADVERIVAACSKQRFTLKPNPAAGTGGGADEPSRFLIRANQGHTFKLDSESLLTPITLEAGNVPEAVVHGTYIAFYSAIVASGGLKRMARNHVHFATGLPAKGNVISGMRFDAELLIWVDVRRSLVESHGNIRWWRSDNGVVLTEGDQNGLVPTRWWKRVEGRRPGIGVLWEDGVKLKDVPPDIQPQIPPRKRGVPRKLMNGTAWADEKKQNETTAVRDGTNTTS